LLLIKDYLIEKIIRNQKFGVILHRNQKGNLVAKTDKRFFENPLKKVLRRLTRDSSNLLELPNAHKE